MRENSVEFVYWPSNYRYFTQVSCPFCTPQHIKLLSEPARTIPELPTLSYGWARAQVITKALPSWFLSQRVPACSEGTLCGVSEVLLAQGTGDGQQVSLEGRESWVAAMGGSIYLEVHSFPTWGQDRDCW